MGNRYKMEYRVVNVVKMVFCIECGKITVLVFLALMLKEAFQVR